MADARDAAPANPSTPARSACASGSPGFKADQDLGEEESEASTTEVVHSSEASASDRASSHGGDPGGGTPRGGSAGESKKAAALPIRPRWSDMCVEEGISVGVIGDASLDAELLACPDSPDASPGGAPSPTKSVKRAQRRRKRREEVLAAAGGASPAHSGKQHPRLPGAVGGVAMQGLAFGIPAPNCVASPVRRSLALPIPRAGAGASASPCSPCRAGASPSAAYAAASPGPMGDASTRTPADACASPYFRGPVVGTDASARTPTAALPWMPALGGAWGPGPAHDAALWAAAVAPSPHAGRSAGGGRAGIVGASPAGSAGVMLAAPAPGAACGSPSGAAGGPAMPGAPFASPAGAAGAAGACAADALRSLLGPAGVPAGSDLAAQLRAAAPAAYED